MLNYVSLAHSAGYPEKEYTVVTRRVHEIKSSVVYVRLEKSSGAHETIVFLWSRECARGGWWFPECDGRPRSACKWWAREATHDEIVAFESQMTQQDLADADAHKDAEFPYVLMQRMSRATPEELRAFRLAVEAQPLFQK